MGGVRLRSLVAVGLDLLTLVVLARLLEPGHFGAVGLALALVTVVTVPARVGVGPAIADTRADGRDLARTAAVLLTGSGAVLWALTVALADPLMSWLGQPGLADVLRWMTLVIPIRLLAVVPRALSVRAGADGHRAGARLVGALTTLVVAGAAALAGLGLWSLVTGYVAGATADTVVTLRPGDGRRRIPTGDWDPGLASGLIRGALGRLRRDPWRHLGEVLDDVLIVLVSGTAALGLYRQARELCTLPVARLAGSVRDRLRQQLTWSQHAPAVLAQVLLGLLRRTAVVVVPAAATLAILAEGVVVVLLGPTWRPMAPIVVLLAPAGGAAALSAVLRPLFAAVGRPALGARGRRLQAVLFVVLVPVLAPAGAVGVAGAVAVSVVGGLLHDLHGLLRRLGLPLGVADLLGCWRGAALGGVSLVAVLAAGRGLLSPAWGTMAGPVALLVLGAAGGGAHLAVVALVDPTSRHDLLRLPGRLPGPLLGSRAGGSRSGGSSRGAPSGASDAAGGGEAASPPVEAEVRATVEQWGRDRHGVPVRIDSVEHLSSWKHAGAFRVRGATGDGRRWRVIWKEAVYGDGHIPALRGLPLRPGPPELAVYQRVGAGLDDLLPEVHRCEEVVPGVRYRYLLEDLAPECVRPGQPRLAMLAAGELPRIHAALETHRPALDDALLAYDGSFGAALPSYVRAALADLEGSPHAVRGVGAVLGEWETLVDAYLAGMERVHGAVAPVVIHGDANPSNIWSDRLRPRRLRLVDWEWAGVGIPHSDLVSALEGVTPDVERRALERFHDVSGARDLAEDLHAYRWCRLQRALLNAGFLANQLMRSTRESPRMGLPGVVARSLGVARATARELQGAPPP